MLVCAGAYVCVCVWACMCVCLCMHSCVCACMYALRIVSTDKILHFIDTLLFLLIIIYKVHQKLPHSQNNAHSV